MNQYNCEQAKNDFVAYTENCQSQFDAHLGETLRAVQEAASSGKNEIQLAVRFDMIEAIHEELIRRNFKVVKTLARTLVISGWA